MSKKWLYVIDEAVKKIENDEVEIGIQALQKVQEHGKALPEVMLYLAEVWYHLGHLDETASLLKEMLEMHPQMDETLRWDFQLMQAEVALEENDFETAQQLLYELKEQGCEEIQLYLLLADLYSLQELDEVAVKYLEMAQQLEPDNEHITAALGNMYIRIGRNSEALQLLDKVEHNSLDSLVFKARTMAQNGEFEHAYEAYRKVLEQDRSPEILYGCGMMAFQLGHLEEARDLLESLLVLDEDYLIAYPLLGDVYLSLGKTEQAINTLQKYVELSGFDLDQIKRLIALLTQAGRYEEAKTYQNLYDQWHVEEE